MLIRLVDRLLAATAVALIIALAGAHRRRMVEVTCNRCSTRFMEPAGTPVTARWPCPACGSTTRLFTRTIASTVEVHVRIGFKAKGERRGKRRVFLEGVFGDDFHRDSQTWRLLRRVVDWEHDRYEEMVTDPESGEVFHRCEEPLSEHRGHGSARRRRGRGEG